MCGLSGGPGRWLGGVTWRLSPKENGLMGVQGEHADLALPEDRRLPGGLADGGRISFFCLCL